MRAKGHIETGGETILIEGVLNDDLRIDALPGGSPFATCTIRTAGPVGTSALAQNMTWQVIIHRAPAVEQMKASLPGDLLEIHGTADSGRILVPRTNGRVDILLTE